MRVALYARVSRDDQTMDTENQLHELREFARRSGWDLTGEYVDRITGGTDQRPEFKRLFDDASKRRFDLVVFWALDRFSREGVLETLQHLKRLEGWSVGWRSYTESFFDSTGPFKDAVIAIMASLAALERQKISDRTKAGLRRVRREGRILGRPRVKIRAVEIRQLQAEGKSLRAIAAETGVSLSSIVRVLKQAA